ncbi:MAG: bifunctional riboflavin kinase/FAD synthetase [Ktedonobacteraceae bacterium]|nr:bifunctional riboflavin kinase/FAD synthetase [Ktedonobacteraceae bacterium]
MEYITTLAPDEPIAITIGNFDGIHKGHQRLMHRLSAMAQELQCKPVLVTFEPHTLMVVKPDIDLRYLTTLEEKLALAKRYAGIADSIVIRFTPQVAAMSAEEFMNHLYTHFTMKGLVVGANFSLGHNRMGDVTFLQRYGREHAIAVYAIPLEEIKRSRISSTRIRALVSEGEIIEASDLLGHPVTASGIVVHGDHRGRQIGFPTANLLPDTHKLLPANGVYAARVCIEQDATASDSTSSSRVYNSAVNIGVRPTFQGQTRLVEAHLLDVDLDLYEKRITLDFIERLRDEQRFPGIEALKIQLTHDVQQARQILQ